ncbi:hypothetical protein ACFV5G_11580 [Streptomyces sp. NPDC059766]|uniref:hypothetical protein n=1 Tax=Streptomyces sp. NPDC059766 TaxID=3346940 RepID=UPI003659FA5E
MKPSTDAAPVARGVVAGPGGAGPGGDHRPARQGRTPFHSAIRRGRWVCVIACVALAAPPASAASAVSVGTRQGAMAPAAGSAPYACSVQPGSYKFCDSVVAQPGETVTVSVSESGTVTRGDFRAVDRQTQEALGTVIGVLPSFGAAVVWRNDTDRSVIVDLLASADDEGRVDGRLVAGG